MYNTKIKYSIFKIWKLPSLINELFTFLSKDTFFSLVLYNKKMQKMLNINLYDYQKLFIINNIKTSLKYLNKIELWNFLKLKYNNFNKNEDFENLKKISDELITSPIEMNSKYYYNKNRDNYLSFTKRINFDINLKNIKVLKFKGNLDYESEFFDYLNLNILDHELPNLTHLFISNYSNVDVPISLIENLEVLSLVNINDIFNITKLKYEYNEINLNNLFYLKCVNVSSKGNEKLKFILNHLEYIFIEDVIQLSMNEEDIDFHFGYLKTYFGLYQIYKIYKNQILGEEFFEDLTFYFMKDIYKENKFYSNLKGFKFFLGVDERKGYEVSINMEKLKNNTIKYKYITKKFPEYYKLSLGILSENNNIFIIKENEFEGYLSCLNNYKVFDFKHLEKITLLDVYEIENKNENGYYKIDLFNIINEDNFILQEIKLFGLEDINKNGIINLFNNIKYFIFLRIIEIEIIYNIFQLNELFILLKNIENLKFISDVNILINLGKISENETKKIKHSFPNFSLNIEILEKFNFLGKQRILNIKLKKKINY